MLAAVVSCQFERAFRGANEAQMFYTLLIISLNVIVAGGGSNLFTPDQLATFTPNDIKERIFGSKIVIVSEQVRS